MVYKMPTNLYNGHFWDTKGSDERLYTGAVLHEDFGVDVTLPYNTNGSFANQAIVYGVVADPVSGTTKMYVNSPTIVRAQGVFGVSSFNKIAFVYNWPHTISEFRIYNHALSASELVDAFLELGGKWGITIPA